MIKVFNLPDLGEGLTESEIVAWHVAPGDTVTLNQHIADVETAKAVVELPSPFAGVVKELHQQPGVVVQVGEPIVSFEVEGAAGAPGAGAGAAPAAAEPAQEREAMLVGYGAAVERGGRPRRRVRAGSPTLGTGAAGAAAAGAAAAGAGAAGAGAAGQAEVTAELLADVASAFGAAPAETETAPSETAPAETAPAETAPAAPVDLAAVTAAGTAAVTERPRSTPPVRALARDLGVDLSTVTGTGPDGLITRDDVRARSAAALTGAVTGAVPGAAGVVTGAETGARTGTPTGAAASAPGVRESRTPIKSVRKHTAAAMVRSAFTAPHVTEFLTVDVTPTVELLDSLKRNRAFADQRINILTVVAKALCIAASRHPSVNTRWDDEAGEIVQFHYVNLGIAAATPRGLLVPNIKDADTLSLTGLSAALAGLTDAARAGTTSPASLAGGTITITNIGVFGIDAGTPILNPGEAAILAMGAIRQMPWEHQGEIALRQVMTLSLSFDHRLVDGEQGSRFLADIGAILANPGMVLTMV